MDIGEFCRETGHLNLLQFSFKLFALFVSLYLPQYIKKKKNLGIFLTSRQLVNILEMLVKALQWLAKKRDVFELVFIKRIAPICLGFPCCFRITPSSEMYI